MKRNFDKNVLKKFKNFLFDCDGVIWKQNHLIDGAKDVLELLKKEGKRIFLISNNSTISIEQYVEKSAKLGLYVNENEIISSSNIMAKYLKSINFKGKVYIVGEEGISIELQKVGIPSIGVGEDTRFFRSLGDDTSFLDDEVKAVVVGFDRYFNLTKMAIASTYIRKNKCTFYATNTDAVFPTPSYILPGTGAMVSAIATATGIKPFVTGKPHSPMFQVLQEQYKLNPNDSIMIGDNLDTDIRFGNDHNMATLLVLSGVTIIEDLKIIGEDSPKYPNYIADSVADLLTIFK